MTNGMDSRIKIVDIRTCKAIHEFSHGDFQTSYNWSSSVFSPDGEIIAFIYVGYFLIYICVRVWYIYYYPRVAHGVHFCFYFAILRFRFLAFYPFLCVVKKRCVCGLWFFFKWVHLCMECKEWEIDTKTGMWS
jgi:hypothetical protein